MVKACCRGPGGRGRRWIAGAAEHLHVSTGVTRAGEAASRSYRPHRCCEIDGLAGSPDIAPEIGIQKQRRHDVGWMPASAGDRASASDSPLWEPPTNCNTCGRVIGASV